MQAFNIAYKLLGRTTTKKGATNGYIVEMAYGGVKILSISELVSIASRGDIPQLKMSFICGKPEFYYQGSQLDSILPVDNARQNITSTKEVYGNKLYFWAQKQSLIFCDKIFKNLKCTWDELIEVKKAYTKPLIQSLTSNLLDSVEAFQEIQFPYVVDYFTLNSNGHMGKWPADKSMFIYADIQAINVTDKFTAMLKIGWQLKITGERLIEEQAKASINRPALSDCYETPTVGNKHLAIQELNKLMH